MTAVYDSEPYAHMIPIHDALAHIQKAVPCEKLPPIPHVSLPGGRGTMTVPAPVSPDLSELDAASVRLTAPRSPISPEHEDLTLAHQSTIHKRLKKAGQHRSHTSVDTFRSHNSAESDKWWEDIDNYSPSIPQGAHENNPPISWSIRSNLQELRLRHGIIDDEGRHPRHSQDRKMNGKRRRLFKDKYAKGWRKLLPSSVRESQFFSSTFCYTSRNSKTFVARAWPAISLAFGLTWIIPVVVVLRINFTSHIVGPSIGCLQSSKKCHLDLRSTQIQQAKPLAKDDQNILVGLQIAAKVLDAWFCSIAASLVWSILKKLAGHDSTRPLPIGYLHIPTECSEMAILPKLFWGRRRDVTRLEGWSKMRLYIFIIFVTCVCILCNLMGPAAAVLVIPSLQWTNINQAQEVWFESMLSTQGPQHSVIIPGCSQDTLEAGNYSCTGVLHSAAVDSFVAAATGPDDPIQNLNNGIAWKQTSSFSPILQDENISFTINFSNPTIWIPSRQILHGISADLDNFDATTMTGGPSSEGHPNPGLFMRSIQSPSRQILHGISTDMDDFNDKTMKGGPSRQILHDKTMKGGLSRQILHGISTDMDDSNDKTMKGGLSPGGYPDSGLFTRSLQSRLQRHGPIFGQQNSCFKTDLSTDIPVGTNRTVRCFGNTDITGVAKCIPQGAGWTNINQAFSNFTIHAIQSSSSVSLIDVSIYTTSSSLYISDPDMRCIKSPTCTSGLDWNAIFLSSQIPQHQNVSGPQQTFVYTRAPESPADGTLIWCDLQTTVAFADYILDPNPITNRIKFVETTTQTPTSNQPLFVHSDWTLAAWSVDSGSSVRGPRGAARKLNAAMESWIANEGASQAPIDFKFIHQFMAIQTLSMIPYNTTIFKPSNTTSNPPLSRKAMVQVWKYGVNSRSSIFGVVVLTLGLICVLARAVLYDKEPTLDATDILIKALKGTSTLLKTNSLSNSSTLLPQDDSGEESEKEKEKDFPVLEIDQTLCARRVSYRRGISFHG
jgi:hypothetical protein